MVADPPDGESGLHNSKLEKPTNWLFVGYAPSSHLTRGEGKAFI